MVATIWSEDTSTTPADGSKDQNIFFPKVVVSQIKLQEMEHGTPCTHIFCTYSHLRPLGLGQRVKHFFSEGIHVAYQVKGNGA